MACSNGITIDASEIEAKKSLYAAKFVRNPPSVFFDVRPPSHDNPVQKEWRKRKRVVMNALSDVLGDDSGPLKKEAVNVLRSALLHVHITLSVQVKFGLDIDEDNDVECIDLLDSKKRRY